MVVVLSDTFDVEELVGEAVIVSFRTVEVVFCATGGVVVVFMTSWKIDDERDADAVMVAFGDSDVDDR